MRYIALFTFTFLLFNLYGQSVPYKIRLFEKHLIDSLFKKFDKKEPDFSQLKSLSKNYKFKSCTSESYLYRGIAYKYSRLYLDSEKYQLKPEYKKLLLDSTIYYYDLGGNVCLDCISTTKVEKLEFYQLMRDKTLYRNELEQLKKLGYKQDRAGFSFGLSSQFGKNNWIGINLSPLELFTPVNAKFFKNQNIIYLLRKSGKGSLFNFDIIKNLNQNETDISFSLLKFTTPIHIDITKFGFINSSKFNSAYGYYRPEIGLGWGIFSAGYAYNLVFKKDKRDDFDKHLFFVRMSYPFLKYND